MAYCIKIPGRKMQRERQEEIENELSMEENAGPLLINRLEVQRQ